MVDATTLFNIYTFVLLLLVVVFIMIWLIWNGSNCPLPLSCPPCPTLPRFPSGLSMESCVNNTQENEYMKDMIRYLTLILKRYEAEKELYVLSNGYAQVYNSPKLEYLKNELRRMLKVVKSDQNKRKYFEKNLNNVIE